MMEETAMEPPIEISFRNLDRSPLVEGQIRERLGKLQRHFDKITSCHVWIDAPARDHGRVTTFDVRIEIRVPGAELIVSKAPGDKSTHGDITAAVRDAFDAMERQVHDHAQQQRGETKTHHAPPQGQIRRLFPERGYGFIALTDGREIYFHENSVVGTPFDQLELGCAVELEVAPGESTAGPQASTVRVVSPLKLESAPPGMLEPSPSATEER